jgi:hypothetical protein
LNVADAERAGWLWGVLQQTPDCTTQADVDAVLALYQESGSVQFALAELDRRRNAALSIPALVATPALLEVLADACDLFVQQIHALLRDRAGQFSPRPALIPS